MKKILFIILIMSFGILTIGWEKNKNNSKEWKIDITDSKQLLGEEEQIFEKAISNYDKKLDYVSLLATQVVSGTNYMFLCKDEKGYKVVVIYHDLEGNSKVTKVSDFNPIKYINKENDLNKENLSGGWYVNVPAKPMMLPEKIQSYFDSATKSLTGISYYPIASIAHNGKNNYAVLCYGDIVYKESNASIYVLTLSIDKNNNSEIASIYEIDLSNYN